MGGVLFKFAQEADFYEQELPPDEPDMVEANGQVWKRTTSAMGPSYY